MSWFDKLVWGIAVLLLIPVLITPAGWAFAAVLVVLWLLVAYGGRYALEVEKQRRQGERGWAHEVRSRARHREEGEQ